MNTPGDKWQGLMPSFLRPVRLIRRTLRWVLWGNKTDTTCSEVFCWREVSPDCLSRRFPCCAEHHAQEMRKYPLLHYVCRMRLEKWEGYNWEEYDDYIT